MLHHLYLKANALLRNVSILHLHHILWATRVLAYGSDMNIAWDYMPISEDPFQAAYLLSPPSFLPFFLRGKTVLYRQPSVSLSFRPSNPTIHYGAFLTSAAWQHNKDDILIQWLVISAKQRQVLQLLLLCEQCHIGKASYANIALGGFYDSSWMGRLAWCCFLWFLAP